MSEQWLGLHNPERHEPYAGQFAGYAECLPVLGGCLAECGEDDPCRCCLAAEVETLRGRIAEAIALHWDRHDAFDDRYIDCGACNQPAPCLTVQALLGAK